jgi:4-amino-4-deoxy-L-arabinose transferase-like glycosyltransferase
MLPSGLLIVTLLLGAALRFHALARDARFHPDEALFSMFARSAALNGDWLLHGPLDKTPLTIYSMALSMTAFSSVQAGLNQLDIHLGEFAARLPNALASLLLVPVMYALAKTVYRKEAVSKIKPHPVHGEGRGIGVSLFRSGEIGDNAVPILAALLMALSPFAIAFSATAFTDGPMLLFITLALWMAVAGRWGWSGLWLALAFASKQQAVFYLPLVLAVGWVMSPVKPHPLRLLMVGEGRKIGRLFFRRMLKHPSERKKPAEADSVHRRHLEFRSRGLFQATRSVVPATWLQAIRRILPARIQALLRFVFPIVMCLVALNAWDMARAQDTSFWALAATNNNPARLIRPNEILPRLSAWLTDAGTLLGPALVTALLLGLAAAVLGWRLPREAHRRETLVDALLATFILGYGFVHWLVAFNTYDRYLLLLLPPLILLAARGIEKIKELTQRNREAEKHRGLSVPMCLCASLLGFYLLFSAFEASEGRINVGGDRGEHDGIDRLAVYLDSRPLGAIVYDHWLGWELDYYLGQWTNKRRVYYPTPEALAADALRQPDPAPRYFPVPLDEPVRPWLEALCRAGFAVTLDYAEPGFVVYRLIPPSASA